MKCLYESRVKKSLAEYRSLTDSLCPASKKNSQLSFVVKSSIPPGDNSRMSFCKNPDNSRIGNVASQ